MKKGIFACLCMLLLSTVVLITSCGRSPLAERYVDGDSTNVALNEDLAANPSFASADEIADFQVAAIEEASINEQFMNMPTSVLKHVAAVCLARNPSINKHIIVEEYMLNRNIYDNLNNPPQDSTNTDTGQGGPSTNTVPLSTSYRYGTDTIDGKIVKVLIKEERYGTK